MLCTPCVYQYWEKCEVTSHIPLWWPIKLQPKDINSVHGQMEEHSAGEHEGDGEDTIALVNVGNNFVVPT
jgi:hypothetical protein